jgi:hypothetical protein
MRYVVTRRIEGDRVYQPGEVVKDPAWKNIQALLKGHYIEPDGSEPADADKAPRKRRERS